MCFSYKWEWRNIVQSKRISWNKKILYSILLPFSYIVIFLTCSTDWACFIRLLFSPYHHHLEGLKSILEIVIKGSFKTARSLTLSLSWDLLWLAMLFFNSHMCHYKGLLGMITFYIHFPPIEGLRYIYLTIFSIWTIYDFMCVCEKWSTEGEAVVVK